MKVLVIDDHLAKEYSREVLGASYDKICFLEDFSDKDIEYSFCTAETEEDSNCYSVEVVETYLKSESKPDAILLDYMFSDQYLGLEILKFLKEEHPEICVIMHTSNREVLDEAVRMGASASIGKCSLRPKAFISRIKEIYNNSTTK